VIVFLKKKSNPYFTPDVIGEPLTNRNFSYIKVFGILIVFSFWLRNVKNEKLIQQYDEILLYCTTVVVTKQSGKMDIKLFLII
jgi:hypothetical protein